jgi:hypothetical protein
MLMPETLPERLMSYSDALTENDLLKRLQNNVNDYTQFFVCACDDENWRSLHPQFISESLSWFTDQFLANTISSSIATEIADSVKQHSIGLKPLLPLNIRFTARDGELMISSLMYQTSSSFFQNTIHEACNGKSLKYFNISGTRLAEIKNIDEYIFTNDVNELWKLNDDELKRMLELSFRVELPGLAELCQILLWHRLDPKTIYSSLITSHENYWDYIRNKSAETINNSDSGIEITFPDRYSVCCYLETITEHTVESFRKVIPIITHLICGPKVAEDKGFHRLLNECPKLHSIDLGRAESYSQQFEHLPEQIDELILSGSSWLNDQNFNAIISHYPSLRSLDLVSCASLTAMGWGYLLKLPNLKRLNISNCSLLTDKELSIILDASPGLIELNLDGCDELSEGGFQQLSRGNRIFEILSLARTHATDAVVIQLSEQQKGLRKLDVSSCYHITEEGIVESLKIAKKLQELNCTACNISTTLIEELKKRYPHIQIIY